MNLFISNLSFVHLLERCAYRPIYSTILFAITALTITHGFGEQMVTARELPDGLALDQA
jgi:hypothetical protein